VVLIDVTNRNTRCARLATLESDGFYDELTPGGVRCADLPGANIFDAFSVVIWPRYARRELEAGERLACGIRFTKRNVQIRGPVEKFCRKCGF